ncbi:PH domain-containing protein [Streptomyces clavuligerus]|nr:membrane protein [Streptomyces clavuligerus]MBY6305470.1 PH domain-containing protein [Streptomyces clavuligerus]QPL66738.1 PH domain-containing protein [Streptomyces clavuligerus]QPL72767.1 PH domain-containing protein [Streptomyces clavuligerus]QPL78845.1 PH domain-containing protein [Streptomyces clavuligerus]
MRPPAHALSERAVGWWRARSALATALITGVLAVLGWFVGPARPWLLAAAALALVLGALEALTVPRWRYRVHRWEVTDEAVHVRTGAFWQEWRIAPMSRIQTVDTRQGPLERRFRLATVVVTTASSKGALTLEGLDHEHAADLARRLTAMTRATPGDAT